MKCCVTNYQRFICISQLDVDYSIGEEWFETLIHLLENNQPLSLCRSTTNVYEFFLFFCLLYFFYLGCMEQQFVLISRNVIKSVQ